MGTRSHQGTWQPASCVPDHVESAFNSRLPLPGGAKARSDVILAHLASFVTTRACAITAGRTEGIEGLGGDDPQFLLLAKD